MNATTAIFVVTAVFASVCLGIFWCLLIESVEPPGWLRYGWVRFGLILMGALASDVAQISYRGHHDWIVAKPTLLIVPFAIGEEISTRRILREPSRTEFDCGEES